MINKKITLMTPAEYIRYIEPLYINELPLNIEELIDMTEWDKEGFEWGGYRKMELSY